MVPTLDVVVSSIGQLVEGPAGRMPHCAGTPGVSYVPKFLKSCGGGPDPEMLERGWDVSFWEKGQGHLLSDVFVCGAG